MNFVKRRSSSLRRWCLDWILIARGSVLLLLIATVLLTQQSPALAFIPSVLTTTATTTRPTARPIVNNKHDHRHQIFQMSSSFDAHETQLLQDRLTEMRRQVYEDELRRPPNASLSAQEFVSAVLFGLYENSDPLPDSGFRLLLRASTPAWRKKLHSSVGAPADADEESVASALGLAMARPQNQFGILVGEGEEFRITFPTDPVDYGDGTCWLECRLRNPSNDQLLVVSGWQLEQRASDGAWLVAGIDWQDFREQFRPGIGREEWMRICG